MTFKLVLSAVVVGALAIVMGCSSDDDKKTTSSSSSSGEEDHTSPFPSCQAILDACHPLDVGEGAIHDCHETAHDDGTEEKCAARKQECLVTCQTVSGLPDGGADAEAGAK